MNSKTLKGRIERIELERSPRHIDRWSFTSGKASQRKTPWLVPACGGLSSLRRSHARPPRNGSDAARRLEQSNDHASASEYRLLATRDSYSDFDGRRLGGVPADPEIESSESKIES